MRKLIRSLIFFKTNLELLKSACSHSMGLNAHNIIWQNVDNVLTHLRFTLLQSRVILEKSTFAQLVIEFLNSTKPERSLPCLKRQPKVPFLSQINAVHTLSSYIFKIHFNIILSPQRASYLDVFLLICYFSLLYRALYMSQPPNPP
jgi:hypothetical protein